ncbi:MAG: inorganic phosphate transporter [Clostridia bacterium]|nr:inorganic phosphate transporter [Clostridia bacterium]
MPLVPFLRETLHDPPLLATALLILGVVFVNGWTDAPNAIATCVSTRCMPARAAVLMAAGCNLLGVLVMTRVSAGVAQTIYSIADFGGDRGRARIALCAAMTAIVLWAVAAWAFGIPTSESHALVAGVSGAAVALGGFGALHGAAWGRVLFGLVFSAVLGFASGFALVKAVARLFRNVRLAPAQRFFRAAQIFGGAAMAFMHGAQDGQKFIGIFLLGISLSGGSSGFAVPLWLMLLCASVMGLGTSIGGYRIIKSVGMDMVRLEKYEGFSADVAGAFCLLVSTVTGLPVSTTHTKTTAIMGVGAARRVHGVRWSVARDMAAAWLLTFPGCGAVGYLTALLFEKLFH